MDRFGSFVCDHEKLDTGIYLSRIDACGDDGAIYTVDVRTRVPYKNRPISQMVAHSIEHIGACQLEKFLKGGQIRKIYWGVMGCMTGFYALFYVPKELYPSADRLILNYLHMAFDQFVISVPFDSRTECGNNRTLAHTIEEIKEVNEELVMMDGLTLQALEQGGFNEYPPIEE